MKKDGGIIKNWQLHIMSEEEDMLAQAKKLNPDFDMNMVAVFTGTVVEDPTGRFESGFHMRSSLILKLDRESGICETQNTIYHMKEEGGDCFPDLGVGAMSIFY